MRFFWKIFFSIMFISITCLSVGSYFLINANFEDDMNQEVKVAYQLCDMINYSINSEAIKDNHNNVHSEVMDYKVDKEELIGRLAKGLEVNTINGIVSFRISNEKFNVLFSSLISDLDAELLKSIQQGEKGYRLENNDSRMFIHVVRPTYLLEDTYYIEVLRDVSHVFESQQLQYEIFTKIIIIMFVVGGVLTAIMSKILMNPIEKLSKATTEIARGDFSKRISVKGNDEFAILSNHFNSMTNDLDQKINELKEAVEKQELFVGAFSHELKTPLTSIIGYSDMLRSKQMSQESVALCANYIFTEGKRLESLSMRMLELIVLKKQEISLRKIRSDEFFHSINLLMRPILEDYNIDLIQNIQPAELLIEPDLMKTVFINLIDNARKAIRRDGVIKVTGFMLNGVYKISIEDNGKGMDIEELNKITKAFYRVDKSRARQDGGAGLGLAICEEILKLHNSNINFESELNRGTIVSVVLRGEEKYEKA